MGGLQKAAGDTSHPKQALSRGADSCCPHPLPLDLVAIPLKGERRSGFPWVECNKNKRIS